MGKTYKGTVYLKQKEVIKMTKPEEKDVVKTMKEAKTAREKILSTI
jgi:hypothetical protein